MNLKQTMTGKVKLDEEVKATMKFTVALLTAYSVGFALVGASLVSLAAYAH